MRVKRRSGKEEEFVREKIVVAVVKAGGRVDVARAVAQEVEGALPKNSVVSTDQIRTEVLNRLRSKDRKTHDSWVAYDKQNKNRS